jgi:hypothetical protein
MSKGTGIQLNVNEAEVMSAIANKTGLFLSGGGKLVLTNQRLLFCNRRKTKIIWECKLAEIMYVGAARNMNVFAFLLILPLFLNSALKISLKNGNSQRFVVTDKSQWMAMLSEYRAKVI